MDEPADELPMSEIERDALKEVTSNDNFDFDDYIPANAPAVKYQSSVAEEVLDDLSGDGNYSIEEQSNHLLAEFDPAIANNVYAAYIFNSAAY